MDRSRTPSGQTLVAGSLLAGTFLFVALVATSSSTTGCSTVETKEAPDASEAPCDQGPFIFCDVAAAGQPSCNTDSATSNYLSRLPWATNYPVGCVVNFVGPRDEQGDCRLEAVCKCLVGEQSATPDPDAGAPLDDGGDAGSDAEAGPPPAPDTSGPAWICNP